MFSARAKRRAEEAEDLGKGFQCYGSQPTAYGLPGKITDVIQGELDQLLGILFDGVKTLK
jgi:hypothetical protein